MKVKVRLSSMPVFGLASDESLSVSSTTLSLGPLIPPSAQQRCQRPLTSNLLKYELPEVGIFHPLDLITSSGCNLSPFPGHPQPPCFHTPRRAISPPPPPLPTNSASVTHIFSHEMDNPLGMPQGNSGISPENTPPGTRPMNIRPAAPISRSSASLETLGYLLQLDPAVPSNYGKSPNDPAMSNNRGSLSGVLERDPKGPFRNVCSQTYAPVPAAHNVHTHSTAPPTFDVFGEAPYQPDVVSGVTEDFLALNMYLHDKEEVSHKDNRWWNSQPLCDTRPVLQGPHHLPLPSPSITPLTNLQSASCTPFPPLIYPRYGCNESSSTSPSADGVYFAMAGRPAFSDLPFTPKQDEEGKRFINLCAVDDFKQKSMEEHRWDTYVASDLASTFHLNGDFCGMTLDFPPLSLSPPAYTLPGFEGRHTQASGRPTVVPDGMPSPVPPVMWGTTSREVHVVAPVANPTERDSLPASSADRCHYWLSGHPWHWQKTTSPSPNPVASGRTENLLRGATSEPVCTGHKQTGSVGSSLDNATCIPSILNMPRASASPNLLFHPQLVAPEVPLSPSCSFGPFKDNGPEAGVSFNVTTQELKGIHPMIASLGYLSHVLRTFQSSPSRCSELEANCRVLETTIGNLAKCLCAQQDKVLQTLLKADTTPPRNVDGITSVNIVDQRKELNQIGGKITQAAAGKFTAEGSTSNGAREVQLNSKNKLHEPSAKCLGAECGAREAQLVSKMLQSELESKDTKLRNLRHKAHKMKTQVADLQSREEQLRATMEELTEALQLERVENKGSISPIMKQGGVRECVVNAGDAMLEKNGRVGYWPTLHLPRQAQMADHAASVHGSSPEMLVCSSKRAQFEINSALMEQIAKPSQETIDAQDKLTRSKMLSEFATDGSMEHAQVGDIAPSCGKDGDTETTEASLLAKVQIRSALIQSRAIYIDDAGSSAPQYEEGWESSAQFDGVSASLEKSSTGSSSSLTVKAVNEVAPDDCASDLALVGNDNRQQSIGSDNSGVDDFEGLLLFSASKASAANICKSSVVTQDPTPADEGAGLGNDSDSASTNGHSKNDQGERRDFVVDVAEALGWEHVKAEV